MLVGRDREWAVIARLLERARAGKARRRGRDGRGRHRQDRAARPCGRTGGGHDRGPRGWPGVRGASSSSRRCSTSAGHCWAAATSLPSARPQRWQNALGLGSGPPADRFLIGAATLSLLAAAAEDAPLLVLLDDAQWIDAASTDALLFAARRLAAEPAAILVAARHEGATFGGGAFASIGLTGVDEGAARCCWRPTASRGFSPMSPSRSGGRRPATRSRSSSCRTS